MRINFVGASFDGCYLYRCFNPLNNSNHDIRGDVDLYKSVWQPRQDILDARVVIFHRPYDKKRYEMMKLLHQKGIIVGYDNDDTWELDPSHPAYGMLEIGYHKKCLQEADFITTSTKFLAKEYRKTNRNVAVIPNLIDFKYYPKPKPNKGKKVRILLSGSVLWCSDSFNFVDVLKEIGGLPNVELVFFGNPAKEMTGWKNVEYHKYVPAIHYPKVLNGLKIDIALIPREDNYFNKAKSNCKYLEMSALKIPVIASSFKKDDGPYDIVAKEGGPILLADIREDWIRYVSDLIENKSLREDIGERAYNWVYKNYNAKLNIFDNKIYELIQYASRRKIQGIWRQLKHTIWND